MGRALVVDQEHHGRRPAVLREDERPGLAKPVRAAGAGEVEVLVAGLAGGAVEGVRDQGASELVERGAIRGGDELQGGEARAKVPGRVREGRLEGVAGRRRFAVVGAQVPRWVHLGQEALLLDLGAPAGRLVGVSPVDPLRGRRAVDRVEDEQRLPLAGVERLHGQDRELVDLLGEDGDILVVRHRRRPPGRRAFRAR